MPTAHRPSSAHATPPSLSIAHLPIPAVLADRDGVVLASNAQAEALGLTGPRLPPDWTHTGPFATTVQTGAASQGQAPPIAGRAGRYWATSPVEGGVLCVLAVNPAQQAADERLHLLEEVVALAGVGGWEVDLQTNTPLWADEVCRIHEVPPGYVPTMTEAIEFYAPEARPIIQQAVAEGMRTGKEWDLELPLITARKRRIWVRARGRPIFEDGQCRRLLGSFEDITDRKSARQETRQALRRAQVYESLFHHANALMAIADFTGHFTRTNAAWTQLLGWTEEELTSRPFLEFVHPEDQARTLEETAALSQDGYQTVNFRNRYRTASGDHVELSWVATSDSEHGHIYAIATDITTERQRERQLQRLATIAARTTNAVLITNREGVVEWANESFTRITGFGIDEVLGRRPGDVLQGPDSDPDTISHMRRQIRSQQPFTVEMLNYHKDGKPYWIAIEALPTTDDHGDFSGFMAVEADITAQRNAQEALIQERDRATQLAREAQAATVAKSGFLAMMSHELRTPLNGILGSAQLLLDGQLAPEHHRMCQTLHDAGRGLLALLNDVLDYSKLDSGQFDLQLSPLDLARMARGCVDLFQAEAQRLGLEMDIDLQPGLPAAVLGDELRLRQVLTNLLGNALKFTETGHIRLTLSQLASGVVRFSVYDTGIGIAPADQDRLFAPFTQVDSSSRRRAGGTGLGLTISQRLVGKMGGTISVDSTVGVGSTFTFEIALAPARLPSQISPTPGPEAAALPQEVVVLLAEDNAINGLVGTKLLERIGCTVVLAVDGEKAVEAVKSRAFDLVLMDCHMPELDGWEATEEIRRLGIPSRSGARLPIVAQTASCMEAEIARCKAAGMDEVLAKPLDLMRLTSAVRRWATAAEEAA